MERQRPFFETLTTQQILTIRDLNKFRIPRITFDFDEILSDTQTPVIEEFYKRTGFDFRGWKIDRWLALAHWSCSKYGVDFNEISKVETNVWSDESVLAQAKPNLPMQAYSQKASEHKIEQAVITTRIPELTSLTYSWLDAHFPWIQKSNVFIRDKKKSDGGTDGDDFKGIQAKKFGSMLHFDDSIASVTRVIETSDATAILFPRNLERGRFSDTQRVIEFPNMNLWYETFKLHQ